MMKSITRSINIVAILTKNKDQNLSSIFIFLKIATMFKLLVILHFVAIKFVAFLWKCEWKQKEEQKEK